MKYKFIVLSNKEFERKYFHAPLEIIRTGIGNISEDDGMCFFNTLKISSYPSFLEDAYSQIGMSYTDTSGMSFGPYEGDYWDKTEPLLKGYVRLSTFTGNTDLELSVFYELCIQFAEKSIEANDFLNLEERSLVDKFWVDRIKLTLLQISEKMKKMKLNGI